MPRAPRRTPMTPTSGCWRPRPPPAPRPSLTTRTERDRADRGGSDDRLSVRCAQPAHSGRGARRGRTDFTYDGLDSRVLRAGPGGTTLFLVDPFGAEGLAQVLRRRIPSGGAADYVYGGATLISQERAGQVAFHLADAQQSTRRLTDGTGGVTDTYDFDAFGNLVARTGTTPTRISMPGSSSIRPATSTTCGPATTIRRSAVPWRRIRWPATSWPPRPSTGTSTRAGTRSTGTTRPGAASSIFETAGQAARFILVTLPVNALRSLTHLGVQRALIGHARVVVSRVLGAVVFVRSRVPRVDERALVQTAKEVARRAIEGAVRVPGKRCIFAKALPHAVSLVPEVLGNLIPSEAGAIGTGNVLNPTARGAGGTVEVMEVDTTTRRIVQRALQEVIRGFCQGR